MRSVKALILFSFGLHASACGSEATSATVLRPAVVTTVLATFEEPRIPVGGNTLAHALPVDRDGGALAPAPAEWRVTSGTDVASVDESGVVTAIATGAAIVAATVDSITGTAQLEVIPSDESQLGLLSAVLPQVFLDFPFPTKTGQTIVVGPGGNLQNALNSAQRGDEIVLAAGATYTGNFTLPAKSGTAANGWITIRSDKFSQLPALGTRVSASHASLMAKIETPNTAPALRTAPGTSGWRLVGLEVTASPSVTVQQYGLIFLGESGSAQSTLASVPSDLVLDRMYIHGQTTTNLSRCVALNSARTEVRDSYLTECHGKSFDSQAIAGWNGPGPYRIVNNMLQGAGENIMFGGSDPSIPNLVPSDIEIRGNYLYTPVAWKGVWQKKNLFELKNAIRVLVEGNVFDGSWVDGQTGWAIVLKSANQGGGCRWCRSTDVTIRRNLIRNAGAGVNVAPWGDKANVDTTARRIHVVENVLDNIGVGEFTGDRRGFQLLANTDGITLERNVLTGNLAAAVMLASSPGSSRAVFLDNVWARGQYGVVATGASPGTPSLNVGAPGYSWSNITLVGSSQSNYPSGTTFVSSEGSATLATQIRSLVSQVVAGIDIP